MTALAAGCHKKAPATVETTAPVANSSSSATGAQSAAISEPAAASHFSAAQFDVNIQADGSYKAGQAGNVLISVHAKPPFHCNGEFPYKFALDSVPGVKFASQVVHKDAVKVNGPHATMTVGFTPETIGKKTIAGRFAFSVCSAADCLVEHRRLKLDIDVKQ